MAFCVPQAAEPEEPDDPAWLEEPVRRVGDLILDLVPPLLPPSSARVDTHCCSSGFGLSLESCAVRNSTTTQLGQEKAYHAVWHLTLSGVVCAAGVVLQAEQDEAPGSTDYADWSIDHELPELKTVRHTRAATNL